MWHMVKYKHLTSVRLAVLAYMVHHQSHDQSVTLSTIIHIFLKKIPKWCISGDSGESTLPWNAQAGIPLHTSEPITLSF